MPFIPHTDADIRAMLNAIGVGAIDDLFDEIPPQLKNDQLSRVPATLGEMELTRLMEARAEADRRHLNFIGAGAYEHHIPAAVWQIVTRGEFYSAYTPYQAEASQGTLQLLYEFQTMIASLTGLDIANASLYDGASALAEACLMAIRAHKSGKLPRRILMPKTVNPLYRRVVHAIVNSQGIELVELPYDPRCGTTTVDAAAALAGDGFAALVLPQPNYFGALEEVDALTDWAHSQGALVIGAVNPTALALLAPPGEWGASGADIAVGEGQPLGVPLASGGPYFGFMCCKEALVRQMPGRIVGRTVDLEGKPGFALTLQAREQHIRRSKATSNICTNQGLLVTAATIYMALTGPQGLRRVAGQSHANMAALLDRLCAIPGVSRVFDAPLFHEALLRIPAPTEAVLAALLEAGILGGISVKVDYPELGEALLVCATETKTPADLERFAGALLQVLSQTDT